MKYYDQFLKQREKNVIFQSKILGRYGQNNWFNKGDRNCNYFNKKMKVRKKRNKIYRVRDQVGIWIENENQVKNYFIKEFQRRFKI